MKWGPVCVELGWSRQMRRSNPLTEAYFVTGARNSLKLHTDIPWGSPHCTKRDDPSDLYRLVWSYIGCTFVICALRLHTWPSCSFAYSAPRLWINLPLDQEKPESRLFAGHGVSYLIDNLPSHLILFCWQPFVYGLMSLFLAYLSSVLEFVRKQKINRYKIPGIVKYCTCAATKEKYVSFLLLLYMLSQ